MNLQPTLENDIILIRPLQEDDAEKLYAVASDPAIWEQHPNKNRYKKEVFLKYFEGAILSKGAFLILEKETDEIIGCSRFYDYDPVNKSVVIGYTFIATKYWGKRYNAQIKEMMIDYAFDHVEKILFHIGANNLRSQIAIGRIGAIKTGEIVVAYYGEPELLNFIYAIEKSKWQKIKNG
jgi:N-acetyltransferase